MFGGFGQQASSPFGQSSSSPFGQSTSSPFGQSLFGQSSNNTANPFAPKPFGSPTANPFGSQTGSSIFGGTSTGVFGQTAPTFGASSSPAFGSSTPMFGASTTPAFGASSSAFGGSSIFGQKPTFGGFGSTTTQSNPFGSSFQQTQPTFGSSPFGSTTSFGASSQPAFGATSTPAFGATATPTFGATSTPAFGATTTPAFGASSTPAFGATSTPAFGATSTPAFGATSTPAFGSTTFGSTGSAFGFSSTPTFGSTPAFGSGSSPIFGASSAPAFGASTTPAFGASSTPSFSFGSSPAFGQSTPAFGTTSFGTTSFGGQATTPAFGSTAFGQSTFGQQGGSRVVPYAPTVDTDGATGSQPAGKLDSISAMPAYKEKSHEELRWEDYQRGDKGGPNLAGQTGTGSTGVGFAATAQSNPFGQTSAFGQTTASAFSSTTGGLFGPKPAFAAPTFGQSTPAFSSPFGAASSSPFGSSTSTSLFGGASSAPAFGASTTPLFGTTAAPAFGSVSPFGSSAASVATPTFNTGLTFGNTQSAGLFQSSPATGQTSLFGQPTSAFGQTTPGSNIFGSQSTGFGGSIFGTSASLVPSSTPMGFGQTTPSFSSPFLSGTPAPTSGSFSFGNFGQTQPAASGFGGISNMFGQSAGQPATQTNVVLQPAPVTNPFGTLPAMPQMTIGRTGASSSIQYGISSIPVSEKPVPVRVSLLLTPRHLSQRRFKQPPRKYQSKSDSPKVPFFYDEEEAPSTPKADALFIPRENPRALVIRPVEQWPSRHANGKNTFTLVRENGKVTGDAPMTAVNGSIPNGVVENTLQGQENDGSIHAPEMNGAHDDHPEKGTTDSSYTLFSGKRAGEAAIVYEHGADIEALMPKLRHPEYYTKPRIQELAAKERAVPGFCRHVKDFVVGRHGYGSIKFEGETDVRRLDLESLVQFNHREVIVYKDENKKPPIGQGLNKPAEITLLNVKCVDKKNGRQYTEGPKVESLRELLKKKAEEQGAEFVSYDPHKGEWKFRVDHFSSYGFGESMEPVQPTIFQLEDNMQKLSTC